MSILKDISGKIVIVGAGIGGVTLAALLSNFGKKCEVYEQKETLFEEGFGLNIQPEAVSILYQLGLAEKLDSIGIQTRAHRYVDQKGALLFEEPRGIEAGFSTPQISISRAELLEAIFSMTKVNATFNFAKKFSTNFSNNIVESQDLIVGADGIHSIVRQKLFPNSMKLNFSSMVLWRGITSMPKMLDGRTMIIANSHEGVRLIAYPVSKFYDLRGESLVNWVLLIPEILDQLPNTELYDINIGRVKITGFLLDILKEWHFDWLDLQTLVTKSKNLMRTMMVDREPLDKWSQGKCVLLGDAAHPMFPIGANGASQSIIDAAVLASAIEHSSDFIHAIAKYEYERIPLLSNIVTANRAMNERELACRSLEPQAQIRELIAIVANYKEIVTKPYSN